MKLSKKLSIALITPCATLIPLMYTIGCSCSYHPKEFSQTSWERIGQFCEKLENGVIDEAKFCSCFLIDGKKPESLNDFVGLEHTIHVNEIDQTVRVIGVQHDTIWNSTQKATLTFEFKNVLCDSNGISLVAIWDDLYEVDDVQNNDYTNSDARMLMDGRYSGDIAPSIAWMQKGEQHISTKYTKPVLNMLPEDVQKHLKSVEKKVSIRNKGDSWPESWQDINVASYDAKVFSLSLAETIKNADTIRDRGGNPNEGSIYQIFDKEEEESHDLQRKNQINLDEIISQDECVEFDIVPGKTISNFAGCAERDVSDPDNIYARYWLRSPSVSSVYATQDALLINEDGSVQAININDESHALAPAFCF